MTPQPVKAPAPRRGAVIIVVLIIIVVTHLAVMGAVTSLADDSQVAAFRVETTRAFYATDSAAMICRKMLSSGVYTPVTGETLAVGTSTVTYLDVPPKDAEGTLVLEGRNGSAVRRVKASLGH